MQCCFKDCVSPLKDDMSLVCTFSSVNHVTGLHRLQEDMKRQIAL